MSPAPLAVVLGLAAAATTWAAASVAVAAAWPRVERRLDRRSPAARARAILALRLAQAALAIVAGPLLVVPATLLFEPPGALDTPGLVLFLLAVLGGVVPFLAAVRTARRAIETRRWLRARRGLRVEAGTWAVPVLAIEDPFPIVAVAGVFRPTLVVSRRVLASCGPALLDAMFAHEREHARAWDNAWRWVLSALPLAPVPGGGARLDDAWVQAREQAADLAAARSHPGAALDLAEALVRVARLAEGVPPPALAASLLFEGAAIEARVRRLVAPAQDDDGDAVRFPLVTAMAAALVLAALASPQGLRLVHAAAEVAVYTLP